MNYGYPSIGAELLIDSEVTWVRKHFGFLFGGKGEAMGFRAFQLHSFLGTFLTFVHDTLLSFNCGHLLAHLSSLSLV